MKITFKNIEELEEKGFKVSEADRKTIVNHQQSDIGLSYDIETLKIYNEGGHWIADLINCNNIKLIGRKWGGLTTNEKEYFLKNANPLDGVTGEYPEESGDCIIDGCDVSISGHINIGDEENQVTIDENEVFYNPCN